MSNPDLIEALCYQAAACWARGNVSLAEQWFNSAVEEAGTDEHVDQDDVR
jgi:hypothetical protein